jgi:acetyl/propionyl-CoA carboxylase alpha subunit
MIEAGVCVPGSVGILESYEQALTLSREFGFPVMLKQLLEVEEKECVLYGKKKIY